MQMQEYSKYRETKPTHPYKDSHMAIAWEMDGARNGSGIIYYLLLLLVLLIFWGAMRNGFGLSFFGLKSR
jgi:hypothetical protein